MFEFVEKVATDIINSLTSSINQMNADAAGYDEQASANDARAAQCESDASAEEASCPHYKSEPYETTDEDGNPKTEYTQVPDTAADAAAMARAAALRAEAANLKTIASALRALASALRGNIFSIISQKSQINQAVQDTQFAMKVTTDLLRDGVEVTRKVIAAFNVPEAKNIGEWTSAVGNNLLGAIGVDLSDGLNDEIYTAIGVVTRVGAVVGPAVVRRTTSVISSNLGNGILGYVGRYEANVVSNAIIETYFNETGAKVAQNAIASALTFIGINSLPTDRSEFVNKNVEIKSEDKKIEDTNLLSSQQESDKVESAVNIELGDNDSPPGDKPPKIPNEAQHGEDNQHDFEDLMADKEADKTQREKIDIPEKAKHGEDNQHDFEDLMADKEADKTQREKIDIPEKAQHGEDNQHDFEDLIFEREVAEGQKTVVKLSKEVNNNNNLGNKNV